MLPVSAAFFFELRNKETAQRNIFYWYLRHQWNKSPHCEKRRHAVKEEIERHQMENQMENGISNAPILYLACNPPQNDV